MRPDMPKKLVERPRLGHSMKNGDTRRGRVDEAAARGAEDYAALPRRAPIRPRRSARKYLNENLAPLKRFLRRRVGRPWDDVYSELRTTLSPSSAIDMHIMQHLYQFVAVHTEVTADGVRAKPGAERCWGAFYVDPRDGTLAAWPPRRWRPPPRPASGLTGRMRSVDRGGGLFYVRVEGVWYAVETAPARRYGWDVVLKRAVDRDDLAQERARRELYGDRALMGVSKRQLGKRALKRARLR